MGIKCQKINHFVGWHIDENIRDLPLRKQIWKHDEISESSSS